jgi:uncharacterized protein
VDADVIVVGAGLTGLVAAAEIADAGKRVLLLDQEGEQSIGGQASRANFSREQTQKHPPPSA